MSAGFLPLLRFPWIFAPARRCSCAWHASGTPLLHRRFQWLLITDRVPVWLPSSSARPTLLDGPARGSLPGSPRRKPCPHRSSARNATPAACHCRALPRRHRHARGCLPGSNAGQGTGTDAGPGPIGHGARHAPGPADPLAHAPHPQLSEPAAARARAAALPAPSSERSSPWTPIRVDLALTLRYGPAAHACGPSAPSQGPGRDPRTSIDG